MRTIIAILATCILGLPTLAAEMPVTPYAGQQARQVKALSDEIPTMPRSRPIDPSRLPLVARRPMP
jgi:hypothetical protein